jgi:hypothetical protein
VAAAYQDMPGNTRAGWGYLLLTNMLPNRGNGSYRLHAIAVDGDGLRTPLGTRTITCTNATATRPFGAIDTPEQGGQVSGTVNNFGWVLSPGNRRADPTGGGSVTVLIDGIAVGSPTGWTTRSDLTSLFPASEYAGVNRALGVYTFDSSRFTNGVHTIVWAVTDNQGNSEGIGSRFFTISNGPGLTLDGAASAGAASVTAEATVAPPVTLETEVAATVRDASPIRARRTFNLKAPYKRVSPDADGQATIQGEELDRIELQLGPGPHAGYLRVGNKLSPLPIGSRLDESTGAFTWQPGAAFVGTYDFVFVRSESGTPVAARDVRVVLNPKSSGRVGPQVVIDTPGAHHPVGRAFVVAGWAVDLDAEAGTGIDTLHVWAYPANGAEPIFLGATAYGGRRPDVGALFGSRYTESGYGLVVRDLAAGDYHIAVFAWSTATGGFVPAKTVPVSVR